jgi:F-type H+-transporting ATPase subunit delta
MAELVTIARPYAEALFKLAREKSNLPGWTEMLALLEAVVSDDRVRSCIGDPNLDARQLESLILGVVGDRLDGFGRNLVQVLIHNGRLELVPEIRSLYEELRREQERIVEATIVSALPVSDEQVNELVARLEARYQRKVTARVEIDAQLIGGVRIVVGDQVIDATVRGRLDAMAAALTH